MKEISYNDYPALLFTSFDKDDAPEELPFNVKDNDVRDYLSRCTGFKEMFTLIGAFNSMVKENTTTNYIIDDRLFRKMDGGDFRFCEIQYDNFFRNYVQEKRGVVMFKDGGNYVYMLLGKEETKALKGMNGRYICTAFFQKNHFIGFEEAIITNQGLGVMNTGYYEGGMELGGYLAFVIVTLAYANNKNLRLYKSDRIREKIFVLE